MSFDLGVTPTMESDVTPLRAHPLFENEDDRLRHQLRREQIKQQQILNWVIFAVGAGVLLFILGIVLIVWKFALTVDL